MRTPKLQVRAFLLAAVLLLAACADANGTAEDAPDETGNETDEGPAAATDPSDDTLVLSTGYSHSTLESTWAFSSISGVVVRNIQEPLVDRSPDDPNEFVPILATEWEEVDDSTLRLQLREGVSFHDGSPFDAEAAAYSFNFLVDEENDLLLRSAFMGPQITAEAVDDHVLELRTEEPDPMLLARLPFFVLPSAQQLQEGGRESWEGEAIGTGPYRLVEWQRNQQIELEANDEWWGGDLAVAHVTFLERPEAQARVTGVEAGEVHLTDQLPPEQCIEALGDRCLSHPSDLNVYLRPDATSDPALGDVRIREAIALAIDKEGIAEQFFAGAAEPASHMIPPGSIGYADDLDPYPFDPDRARELVQEAAADGIPVEDELVLGLDRGRIAGAENLGEILQASLQDVGLNVDLLLQDEAAMYEWFLGNAPEGRNHMAVHQHQNRAFDYSFTLSGWILCDGTNSTYCNEEVDELAAEAAQLTGDERHAAYQEVARLIHEDVGIIPLWFLANNYGVADNLEWSPRADQMMYVKEMSLR